MLAGEIVRVTHSLSLFCSEGDQSLPSAWVRRIWIFCSACSSFCWPAPPDGCPVRCLRVPLRGRTLFQLMHYGFQLFQGGIKTQTVDFLLAMSILED